MELLSHLWRAGQYGYYWLNPPQTSQWFRCDDIPACPGSQANIYFGVNPVADIPTTNARGEGRPPQSVRSQNDYISVINCLFGEFDFKDYGDRQAIKLHLGKFPKPSIAVFSGGGYHLYWLLDQPFMIQSDTDRARAKAAQYNWVDWTGSDKQSKDLARVLRVPGTRNYKPAYAPDYPTVEIIKADYSLTYSLEYLEDASKPEPKPEPEPLPEIPHCPTNGTEREWYERHALNVASRMIREAPDGEKHGTLLRAARLIGGYIAGGIILDSGNAVRLLETEISHKANVEDLNGALHTIQDGVAYGQAEPITLEDKLRERAVYRIRQEKAKPKGDKSYWGRQFVGYWEKARG